MKKIGILSMAAFMLAISTLTTGCMGSFAISKKLYKWNEKATGNKFIDNLIFWLLSWVYGITIFVDAVFLNLIEFWSGSNPLAMGPNDRETQVVLGKDGETYQVTASQNKFEIVGLSGNNKGKEVLFTYNPTEYSWTASDAVQAQKFMVFHPELNKVELIGANGEVKLIDASVAATQMLLDGK